ncbi:hypothetical protein EBR21_07475, partial [bacterium]|nr:hypothetical protein [bacterium]
MDEIESQSLQKQTSFKTPGTTLDFTPISKTEAVLAEEIQTVTEPKVSVEKVGFDDIQMDQDSVQPQAVPAERPRIGNTRVEPDDKNILGLISVFCFFFAAFLLIKFSIASGWLT